MLTYRAQSVSDWHQQSALRRLSDRKNDTICVGKKTSENTNRSIISARHGSHERVFARK